jgi:hypothetical protein
MVGGARAIGLPGGRGHPDAETFPMVAAAIATATLVAGPGLAALQAGFANPAQADVMTAAAGTPGASLESVATVSTVLPALTIFAPLLVLAAVLYGLAGTRLIKRQARPALFTLPGSGMVGSIRAALRRATLPEQYRSLVNLPGLESAVAGGRPVLWLASLVALAFAVTR